MKLKNFAFFGVMASILTISGAYAADGTIIASKGYVDTNFQANNRYQIGNNSWSQVASADKTSDAKYPSMKTLTAAVGNGVSSVLTQNITDGDTTHAPSGDAVADAIAGINTTINNIDMDSKVDKQQTEKGAIMVTNGTSGQVETAKVGKHLAIKDGTLQTTYKAGTNIEIANDGTISATDTVYDDTAVRGLITTNASNIATNTSNIATNTSNITSLQSGKQDKLASSHVSVTGSGNAITDVTAADGKITAKKDTTFLTSADITGKVDVVQESEAAKNGFLMGNARGELNTFVGLGENMEIKEGKLLTKVTDTNTTYTGSDGITLSGTNFTNSGVRAVSESTSNGKITVNTNGTPTDVAVHGLKSAAYKDASEFQAAGDYVLTVQGAAKTGQVMMTTGEEGNVAPVELGENLAVKEGKLTSVDTNTTYTGSNGITLTGTNFTNSGVREISESTSNGKIKVNTNGTETDVAIHGLGSAAYASTTDFAPAGNYQQAGDYVLTAQGTANTVMVTDQDGNVKPGTLGNFLAMDKNGNLTTTYSAGDNIEIKEDGSINTKGLAKVATSGSYNDLSNKPTINDATLTIKKNNTSVGTFTANSGTDASINIEVPTGALASKDTIKDADVASDAAIQYAKMSGDLKEITTNGAATCNAQNPCVLSYIGNNKYRWTNMDIAGLTVAE